jgi:hypothetical protein
MERCAAAVCESNLEALARHTLVHSLCSRIRVDELGVQRNVLLVLGFINLSCHLGDTRNDFASAHRGGILQGCVHTRCY